MASEDIRNSRRLQWSHVKSEKHFRQSAEGGFVVDIQPNVEVQNVEVQEVVVDEVVGEQSGDIQTVAMEEVQEDIPMVEIPEELLVDLKNEGRRQFQKRAGGRYATPYYHTMPLEQHHQSMDDYYTDDEDYDPRYDADDGARRSFNSRRNRRPSKRRDFAHRLQWRNKDMLEAMCAVEERKLTIRGAAKKFGVPYSTLKDRVHGRVKHGVKPGVKTVLSPEEEEELVNYIRDMESAGFQVKHMDIRDRAGELLRLNHGLQSPYKDCSPGHNWLAGFIKRHPGLEFKRQNARNNAPSITKQKMLLRKFFDVASQVFKKGKLYSRPDRVFALADIKLQLTVHGAFFPKATVFLCAAANGAVLPPFVVFRGHLKRLNEARETYPDAFFMCSYQGGSDPDIFHWWLRDFFLRRMGEGAHHPTALYMCRPVGDVTLQVAQLAKEERVSVVAMPSGTEHLLQALDAELCNAFKDDFVKRVEQWEVDNAGVAFSQKAFALILQKVWRKSFGADDIVQKFAANGLYPLNPLAISAERIVASASMAVQSEDDDDGDVGPPLEAVGGAQDGAEGPLSGLNLLSALSTHEFASLENASSGRGGYYAARNVGGQASGVSTGHRPRRGRPRLSAHEDEDQDQEVEEDYSYEAAADSYAPPQRNYRTAHDEITATRHFQQPLQRGRPSSSGLVDRLTANNANVRHEIAAARQNDEQITRAIDSILEREMVAGTVEVEASSEEGQGLGRGQQRGFINITPNAAASGRPRRDIVGATAQPRVTFTSATPSSSAANALSTAGGAGGKSVKIIKVKVEKGTDLQQLAKQLTAKIKDEREKQSQQQQQARHGSTSLQVIKTIAFPGMISAEALNAEPGSGGYRSSAGRHGYRGESEGQVIEETVEEGVVMDDQGVEEGSQEVVEEQVVDMEGDTQQQQQEGGVTLPEGLDLSGLQPGQRVVLEDGREYVVHLLQGADAGATY